MEKDKRELLLKTLTEKINKKNLAQKQIVSGVMI
jgi:hypothetical protein